MKCEYCGRTNHDDGHGGCFACGAPVKHVVTKYAHHETNNHYTSTCCTMVSYRPSDTNQHWK